MLKIFDVNEYVNQDECMKVVNQYVEMKVGGVLSFPFELSPFSLNPLHINIPYHFHLDISLAKK